MYKNYAIKPGRTGRRLYMVPKEDGEAPSTSEIVDPVQRLYSTKKATKVYSVSGPRLETSIETALQTAKRDMGTVPPNKDFGKNLVYMDGSPYSPLMFIGEAPGGDEDIHQTPFVGLAGKQLTTIIEGGMRIPRESVVICNLLKWRPPENRNPKPEEIESAEPHLRRQISILAPKVIITLGKFATNWTLGKPLSSTILSSRGVVHTLESGVQVVATYHPSYLIRQYTVANRRAVLHDVTLARNALKEIGFTTWWIN